MPVATVWFGPKSARRGRRGRCVGAEYFQLRELIRGGGTLMAAFYDGT